MLNVGRNCEIVKKYLSIACRDHDPLKKSYALSCIHGLKTVFFLGLATLYCTLSHFFTGFESGDRLYRLLHSSLRESSCTLLNCSQRNILKSHTLIVLSTVY